MKIGIVTYWKSRCNYGEQLQNYALQKYLKDLGHEPFLICYDYDNDTVYGSRPLLQRILKACNPVILCGYFKTRREKRLIEEDCLAHPRGFDEFRKRNLSMSRLYSSIDELKNDPPEADIYITGSDQVWNSFEGGLNEMRNRLECFFLNFGSSRTIKLSYAASWGRDSIPEDEAEFVKPFLMNLDAVSVREKQGIKICTGLGRDDAVQACDPVLLHSAEDYRKLYNGSSSKKEPYLFFYYMNNDGDYDRQAVFDLAERKNLKVIYVTDDRHDDHERSFPAVEEWLSLIDNAEYVITNSYHCVLFSLIFSKKFGVIRRFGKYTGMNTRMDSVFETFGISPRYIDDADFEIIEQKPDVITSEKAGILSTPEVLIEKALNHSGSNMR